MTLADGSEVTASAARGDGRRVDLGAVGLDAVGVDVAARSVPVDDQLPASSVADGAPVDGVYAIGDCHRAGRLHARGRAPGAGGDRGAARRVPRAQPDHRAAARDLHRPEIGAVGLTEAQAREQGLDVQVATATLAGAATRGWIHGPGNDGFLTVVASGGRLVGATSAGPTGGEVLGALSVAVQAGIPVADLRRQIWAYPTMHRGIEYVLSLLDSD